jgi:hypothetical protein
MERQTDRTSQKLIHFKLHSSKSCTCTAPLKWRERKTIVGKLSHYWSLGKYCTYHPLQYQRLPLKMLIPGPVDFITHGSRMNSRT